MKSLLAAVSLALLVVARPVAAADDVAALEQAKTYFNAGAQAFEAGSFKAAIQAFEQAYRLSPKPGIIFSMAQAHRRQYYLDKRPEHLLEAIKEYRDYVTKVEQGGRRADAAEALAELEPIAARLDPAAGAIPPVEVAPPTRVMVSSQTKGARVTLDGGAPGAAPLIGDVKPGKHVIRIEADGFFAEDRELLAAEGSLVALDISLRERPARVSVDAASGAQISVDGRPAGTTPLVAPLELSSGRHLVTVIRNGSRPYSEEIDLARGEQRHVRASLDTTGQRYASYAFLAAGAGGLVAGGLFTGLALGAQHSARVVADARTTGNISAQQLDDYNQAIIRRDAWKQAAGVGFGAGALVIGTGLVLFAFDHPTVGSAPARLDDSSRGSAPARPPAAVPAEMSAVPLLSPGFVGGELTARF